MVVQFLGLPDAFSNRAFFGQNRSANFWSMMQTCGRLRLDVVILKESALDQRNLHRLKIAGGCAALVDLNLFTRRRHVAFDTQCLPIRLKR